MRKPTLRGPRYDSTLAKNLRLLIESTDEGSVNAWAVRYGFNQGTVNRVVNGSRDTTVGQLEEWASIIGCAADYLLRSDFDPGKVAQIADPRSLRIATNFQRIKLEADKQIVETLVSRLASPN